MICMEERPRTMWGKTMCTPVLTMRFCSGAEGEVAMSADETRSKVLSPLHGAAPGG